MTRRVVPLLLFLLPVSSALAQIKYGSVGVVYYSADKIVIAADSRSTTPGGPPDDTACKIAVLGTRIVAYFFNAFQYPGDSSDLVPGWNVMREARRTYERQTDASAGEIAAEWTSLMAGIIRNHYALYSAAITRVADNEIVTGAVFAESTPNSLSLVKGEINLQAGLIGSRVAPVPRGYTSFGRTEIHRELSELWTPRARQANEMWNLQSNQLAPDAREAARAIHIATLTIAYDRSGTVGGPIDALELRRGGEVRWIQRKPNCPAG